MHRWILQSRVIQTDDTLVKVQDPKTGARSTGRMWTYLGDWAHPFVIYDYTPDRSASGPQQMLKEFRSGYLQADADSAYDPIHARGIVEVGCMAHARRRFNESKTSDAQRAHAALAWISRLYQIERTTKEQISEAIERMSKEIPLAEPAERAAQDERLAEEIRHKPRQEQARPMVEKFAEWLETTAGHVLPKSPVGEAIGYAQSNWLALTRHLDLGLLSIDNNAAEQTMRPVAVGRKNWLHLGSGRGGRTAAVLMSLVQSCRPFGAEPFAYLRDLLNRVSTHPASRIAELLPDAWKPLQP
jgi:hypothetical protein